MYIQQANFVLLRCSVALRHTNFFKHSLSILEMGRPSYVCATCSEHFTRKYSAKRHNENIHNGTAEIVRLIDYLAGRSSGRYMPDNPFWHKQNNPYHNVGSATIVDSIGDTFKPSFVPQQTPLGIPQNSASPMYLPRQIMNLFCNNRIIQGIFYRTILRIYHILITKIKRQI
jgi:hypothetical protein